MRASVKMALAGIVVLVAALAIVLVKRGSAHDAGPTETRVSSASEAVPTTSMGMTPPLGSAPGGMPPLPPTVDLAALRKKLPDNLYWTQAAPTDDPAVLARRTAEARDWNTLFGKVQSNTATEPEIAKYYDHRRQVSHDYAELARTVLADDSKNLDPQSQGIFALAERMNEQRLKQLPVEQARAVERHRAHEAAKTR